jgi:peptide deformylase
MLHIETGKENPILRKICAPIKQSEWKQYVKLGREIVEYIKNPDHAGVWLAAPQIGVDKRLIVVSLLKNWDDKNFSTVMMLNPEIIETSLQTTCDIEEGCLSLPKTKKGFVARYKDIKIRYFDEKMQEKVMKFSGLSSVIIQHEIDHLNGILYIDKLI